MFSPQGRYVYEYTKHFPPFSDICPECSLFQALKAMVEDRYQKSKEKAKAFVSQATAVSLTADMWTSMNTDSYPAVTCHFIDASTSLQSVVLGVQRFPQSHTAENLARVKAALMSQWGITHKITGLVTDSAANMGACAKALKAHHITGNTAGHQIKKNRLL